MGVTDKILQSFRLFGPQASFERSTLQFLFLFLSIVEPPDSRSSCLSGGFQKTGEPLSQHGLPLNPIHGNPASALKENTPDLWQQNRQLPFQLLFLQVCGIQSHPTVNIIAHSLGDHKALCHQYRTDGNSGSLVEIRCHSGLSHGAVRILKKRARFLHAFHGMLQLHHTVQLIQRFFIRFRSFRKKNRHAAGPVFKIQF